MKASYLKAQAADFTGRPSTEWAEMFLAWATRTAGVWTYYPFSCYSTTALCALTRSPREAVQVQAPKRYMRTYGLLKLDLIHHPNRAGGCQRKEGWKSPLIHQAVPGQMSASPWGAVLAIILLDFGEEIFLAWKGTIGRSHNRSLWWWIAGCKLHLICILSLFFLVNDEWLASAWM